jgi:hypothetical protein
MTAAIRIAAESAERRGRRPRRQNRCRPCQITGRPLPPMARYRRGERAVACPAPRRPGDGSAVTALSFAATTRAGCGQPTAAPVLPPLTLHRVAVTSGAVR